MDIMSYISLKILPSEFIQMNDSEFHKYGHVQFYLLSYEYLE